MPAFLARFLTRFLTRFLAIFLARVFDQGFGDRKYSVQYYWDGEIQCTVLPGQKNTVLQYYRDGEKLEENHVIRHPIL